MYFIPPVVSYSRWAAGIATTDSGMTIACHGMSDDFDEKKQQAFKSAMEMLLSD